MTDITQRELDALQKTLNVAIDTFRNELISAKLPPLSLQAQERHPLDEYTYLASPRLYEARRLTLASLGQLKNLIQTPFDAVLQTSFSGYDTACFDVLVKTGVVDRLAQAPDRTIGLHTRDLQEALDVDARKLTTILRYLCSHGWVRETKESVFALNRSALELLPGRNGRYWADMTDRSHLAAYFVEWLKHPQWKYSDKPSETAFQIVHKTNLPLFAYLKENEYQGKLYIEAIRSIGDAFMPGVVYDYPWDSLTARTIVDCGGGQGYTSISLAKAYPSHRFIVQDLPETVPVAAKNMEAELPQAFELGVISAEVHDFFQPQKRSGDEYNYLFHHVLHDWPDDAAVAILRNIAQAAGAKSKVLVLEVISTPATIVDPGEPGDVQAALESVSGNAYKRVPPPPCLLSNYGVAAPGEQGLNVFLMGITNAQARTVGDWEHVISAAGLQIDQVFPLRSNVSIIECSVARS